MTQPQTTPRRRTQPPVSTPQGKEAPPAKGEWGSVDAARLYEEGIAAEAAASATKTRRLQCLTFECSQARAAAAEDDTPGT